MAKVLLVLLAVLLGVAGAVSLETIGFACPTNQAHVPGFTQGNYQQNCTLLDTKECTSDTPVDGGCWGSANQLRQCLIHSGPDGAMVDWVERWCDGFLGLGDCKTKSKSEKLPIGRYDGAPCPE